MPPIDDVDLYAFDLNLLVALDALLEDRSVTRAAARLGVGQPAMSHSLATLRRALGDDLLVRVGPGMQPTPRALALAPRVRAALDGVRDALRPDRAFDPSTARRTFRLGFSSELEVLVLPDLAARLRATAPGVRLIARPARADEVHACLDDGALDLAVGCYEGGAAHHRAAPLFEQTLACCVHPARLALPDPADAAAYRAAYLGAPHVLLTRRDALQGCLAAALDRLGASLDVAAAASDFLAVLATAAAAPVVATVPARLARRYAPGFGLLVRPVPLELQVPAVAMVWSARLDRDAAATWLRAELAAVLDSQDL